jgi:uncharacterized protein (TIGR02266 family)
VNRDFAGVEEFVAEYVANISRSGAFIRTDDPLAIGTRVALRFTVIMNDLETIEGMGMVVRRVAPGGGEPAGMGVVFTELTSYSRELIDKIMTRR